jgi:TP901 family phage tail tape measure protein|nr:MAG TPA: minor tail protein [Caudoviricetes sp.]
MTQAFDYNFNVSGDFMSKMNAMNEAVGQFSGKVESAQGWVVQLSQKLAAFELASGYVERLASTFEGLAASGVTLDSQMHDLSAVAGVTGDALKEIEGYARDSAKAFGTDAGVAVEGYKLLLSQLTPELGKCPAALKSMGESIQITSKLMGGDGVAAAQVLTTAMNQYGVSLDDPIAASKTMADMMNTMAAAGQAGSAELPAIKAALEQCGMAAKAANVSFEETNAAIQVLDKAGKKGSEGGVDLRNTMTILSQGRFLPKDTREELEKAGIDVLALGDKNKTLKERLEMLKPVLNDSALFSKLFGMENANAARALVQGTDKLAEFTEAVTGTSSAEEQAAIIMDSYAEKQARINQQIEDVKISLFQATGGATMWAGALSSVLVPVAQLMPLFTGLGSLMTWIKGIQWANMWGNIRGFMYATRIQVLLMNRELVTGQFVSNGFMINITRATLAVVRFATVGIMQGLKALGAFLLSLVTTGTASTTFAGIASTAFGAFKLAAVTACRAVSVAIMNIPIIGWIAAAIAALVAIGVYFWNTSAKFRAVLKGLWASFKTVFTGIGELAKQVFGAIGDLLKACFNLDSAGISKALDKLKGGFSEYGKQVGAAFNSAYDEEMAAAAKEKAKKDKKGQTPAAIPGLPVTPSVPTVTAPTTGTTNVIGGKSGNETASKGADKIRNITVNIERLVDKFEVHTATLTESAERVRETVTEVLLSALNDTQLA